MSEVIIALDFPGRTEVMEFLDHFEESLYVKIGMELYYQTGPEMVREIKERGHRIFLDLKLHDIPNTVESAMRGLRKLGVDMANVHAAGGIEMMEAARRGLGEGPILLAVTQLTSTSEAQMHSDQLIEVSLEQSVLHYAACAQKAGLDGVVCSPLEAQQIANECGEEFLRVTPGIRPATSDVGDQKRVMTPSRARQNGSSYIVVGRPITKADNPYEAYVAIKNEWEQA
ncbi:orotidine-5'-phosphate decarboxylase [Erysipelothrix sp. HDW6B]|uniref:orotidine-5'-phosphate decarboxylase n=1 Tax=Erysipelothrix sp. HDW6B TaxID=2714929 RepID=UPI00140BE61C|nr:orotidine-5'-phosphate decarboxylase [Erysipelothrix sp. HDW6B]QIK85272.1 orotidine-5'-phosphate decarboxylase [Erysipelothrix sp. HDW6B]